MNGLSPLLSSPLPSFCSSPCCFPSTPSGLLRRAGFHEGIIYERLLLSPLPLHSLSPFSPSLSLCCCIRGRRRRERNIEGLITFSGIAASLLPCPPFFPTVPHFILFYLTPGVGPSPRVMRTRFVHRFLFSSPPPPLSSLFLHALLFTTSTVPPWLMVRGTRAQIHLLGCWPPCTGYKRPFGGPCVDWTCTGRIVESVRGRGWRTS